MSEMSDAQFCHEIIQDVSRTFAIGIDRAEEPLSSFICVSYLLCRIPDTIEDDNRISLDKKEKLLLKYEDILENPNERSKNIETFIKNTNEFYVDKPYWKLVRNTDKVFNTFKEFPEDIKNSVKPHISEMITGMREMISRHEGQIRIQDMNEFSEYCYYVAGTVGNLLTELFKIYEKIDDSREKKLENYAEDFGEALQTVNIIKDVYDDYKEENHIYVPSTLLKEHGSSHEKILENKEGTLKAIGDLKNHGLSKLKKAKKYIELIPFKAESARDFTIIPYLLAVSTLREALNNKERIVTSEPVKMSRNEVLSIIKLVPNCINSNEYLNKVAEEAHKKKITSDKDIE